MKDQLLAQINENPAGRAAREVVRRLKTAGFEGWLVGGGVRDLLLGRCPGDFDVATSAVPDDLARLFPGSNMVGAKFGVFIVKVGEQAVEVATFREEGEYHDRRRPDMVRFSSLEKDAARRDFTCNALYFDPDAGELRDLVGGMADLKNHLLRAVGTPEQRFQEDSLRVLRGVRFAANLGFDIEESTWQGLVAAVPLTMEISVERVRDEILRGLLGGNAQRFLYLMDESGLLALFLPEVTHLKGCEQSPEHHPEGDVFVHTGLLLKNLPANASAELAMAALLHDIGKPPTQTFEDRIRFNGHDRVGAEMAEGIARRLRLSNAQTERLSAMVRRHMQFMNLPKMRTATLKKFLAEPTIEDELELHRLDCLASHGDLSTYELAREKLQEFRDEEARGAAMPRPLITGRHLIAAGYTPGPAFSRVLHDVYEAQLDREVADRTEALALAADLWHRVDLGPKV